MGDSPPQKKKKTKSERRLLTVLVLRHCGSEAFLNRQLVLEILDLVCERGYNINATCTCL